MSEATATPSLEQRKRVLRVYVTAENYAQLQRHAADHLETANMMAQELLGKAIQATKQEQHTPSS